jgi:hypothetical protein
MEICGTLTGGFEAQMMNTAKAIIIKRKQAVGRALEQAFIFLIVYFLVQ